MNKDKSMWMMQNRVSLSTVKYLLDDALLIPIVQA
jgi:hypothetical protein